MKVNVDFEITKMKLDDFEIPIPEGFSEILNRAGAWEISVEEIEKNNPLDNYERKVVREDGRVKTYLTYKKEDSKCKSKSC